MNNLKQTCGEIDSFAQIPTLKLSNLELVSPNLTAEYMSINTELYLFRCLKGIYLESTIERSVYHKRRKKLFDYTEPIRTHISQKFVGFDYSPFIKNNYFYYDSRHKLPHLEQTYQ